MSFFNELKRRNVFRVVIGYIVSSWLLVQVADLVLENIGSPDWVIQTIMLVIALGFPVVVFFSWAYEVTPEGIKRESEVDRSESISHVTGRKLDYSILAVLVFALGYFIWEARFSDGARDGAEPPDLQTTADGEVITAAGLSPETILADRLSIAVLPFDSRSDRPEDEFFAEGIHDDLLTTISKIGSMKVISRTSVMEYRDTTKKLPQIAVELGVAHILEGGIQRSGNTVRINVQLIDAQTDEHLWAEIFDRELTAENLFAIQSEITKAIADALQATLTPQEQIRIDTAPTENLLANEHYLRGRQLMATRETGQLLQAIEEFQKAVELDPEFALAWVGVSDSLNLSRYWGALTWEETSQPTAEAVQKALSINDQLGEAYASLGNVHWNNGKTALAEAAFRKATVLSPNYPTGWHWLSGLIRDNYPLRMDEAIAAARMAAELDPRSSVILVNLAGTYQDRGLYSTAEQQLLKIIEMQVDFVPAYNLLALHYVQYQGRYDKALPFLLKAIELFPDNVTIQITLGSFYRELGLLDRAEGVWARLDLELDDVRNGWWDFSLNLIRKNQAGMLESLDWLIPRIDDLQNLGFWMFALGDAPRALELYLSAEPGWLKPDQWDELLSQYSSEGCYVGWVMKDTGDEELGRQLIEKTTHFMEVTLPVAVEHAEYWGIEWCYLAAGNTESAFQSIETQLAHGHLFEPWLFSLPVFDPIRMEPRFLSIAEEVERRHKEQRLAVEALLVEAGL